MKKLQIIIKDPQGKEMEILAKIFDDHDLFSLSNDDTGDFDHDHSYEVIVTLTRGKRL